MSTGARWLELRGETLEYVLQLSDRRTLGITVFPSGEVLVIAPRDTPVAEVEARLRRRAGWVMRTRREFASYRPRTPPRRYVSGETHRYLGRQIRLLVRADGRPETKLEGRYLVVQGVEPLDTATVRRAVQSWYGKQAKAVFSARLDRVLRQFALEDIFLPSLVVKRLTKRWGSMSPDGRRMVLNTRLVEAKQPAIDYVIMHELCHAVYPHHGPRFFELLAKKMPDWDMRKKQLERALA